MIVVDSNIVAHLFLPSDSSPAAEKVMQRDGNWIVPRLWRSEFRNILATHLRVQKISLESAFETMAKAEELLRDREYEVSSVAVLTLSQRSGASGYDCEFVALAQQFGIALLTGDRRLTALFPETAILLQQWLARSF